MLDFLIFTILFLVLASWFQMKPFFWNKAGIPYSMPLPIVGSMGPAFYTTFRDFFKEKYKKIGHDSMYGFHFFTHPGLILRDPNLIKKVGIVEADKFMDRGFHTESYDPMSKGLFFAKNEEWKVFRSKMTPYFTPSRIKAMVPIVKPVAEDFTRHLSESGKRGPVDVHSASMKLAVDYVMCTVFGLKPDSFVNPNSFFFGLQRELISFIFGVKVLLGNMSPWIYGMLGLTLLAKRTTRKLIEFVNDVIDQRLKGIGNRPDFVQGMTELMQKEQTLTTQLNKPSQGKFDRFSISGQCMLMYAAGTETTGNTLSMVLYELAKNQDVQNKVRHEINDMLHKTEGKYDFEDLHELRYLSMVIKETLRLYPVLVVFARKCTKPLNLDGIELPKGTQIFLCPICLHHDPEFFPEPEKFDPERFSDESNIIPGTYIPFGLGPRTCIGMKFAQTEIMLALCHLLPHHVVTISEKTQLPIQFSSNPTLSPANGIWLNVKKI